MKKQDMCVFVCVSVCVCVCLLIWFEMVKHKNKKNHCVLAKHSAGEKGREKEKVRESEKERRRERERVNKWTTNTIYKKYILMALRETKAKNEHFFQ